MKKKNIYAVLIVFMLLMLINTAVAANILLWDNDNFSTIYDPEGAGIVGCQYAIEKALNNMEVDYQTLSYLPMDLDPYNILLITLGHWCFG